MKPISPTDEKALLLRLRDGDEAAFTYLYSKYYSPLYLHAYNRLRDREAAKDIIQDLFTNIWSKREVVQINEGISSYLYTAVRNRIIDIISKQKSSSAYIRSFGNYLHQSHDTPDYLVREKELAAMIEREISLLSPQLKTVFELSRNEHLSHREIAEKLGLTEQTVRGYIKNALKTLKLKFGTFFLFVLFLASRLF